MPDGKGRLFTQEEVNSILSRAVERQSPTEGGLTYDELLDAARQAGISAETIDAAASEVDSSRRVAGEDELARAELAARTWRQRRGFVLHFTVFAMVMVLLGVINGQTWRENGVLWVLYPLLGWGIGLAAHFASVAYAHLFPDPRAVNSVRHELRRREEKRRRRESRGALEASAKELGGAVERGMANLLMNVAGAIDASVAGASREERDREAKLRVATKARVERVEDTCEDDEEEDGNPAKRGVRR
jgi:2TM domain